MDIDDWRPRVAAYLEGRTLATGMDVARSVGRTYSAMTRDDWATLAAVVIACGWRKAKVDGVPVWKAPAAAPAPSVRGPNRKELLRRLRAKAEGGREAA